MKRMTAGRFMSMGGLLTALAVILQSAPVFLPAVGLALSPFSTLPVALAAYAQKSLGIAVYFVSALILVFVYVQEAIIFLFTTGLLGVAIGTLLFRTGIVATIVLSSILLSLGMSLLTYVLGVPVFGDFADSASTSFAIFVFLLFSFIYTSIWSRCLRKFIKSVG